MLYGGGGGRGDLHHERAQFLRIDLYFGAALVCTGISSKTSAILQCNKQHAFISQSQRKVLVTSKEFGRYETGLD